MVTRRVVFIDTQGDSQFARALEFLKTRVDLKQTSQRRRFRDEAICTAVVVLWMLVFWRLPLGRSHGRLRIQLFHHRRSGRIGQTCVWTADDRTMVSLSA